MVTSAQTGRKTSPASSSWLRFRWAGGASRHTAASSGGPVSDMAAIAAIRLGQGPSDSSAPETARVSGPICSCGWVAYRCSPPVGRSASSSRPPEAMKCHDWPAPWMCQAAQPADQGQSSSQGHSRRQRDGRTAAAGTPAGCAGVPGGSTGWAVVALAGGRLTGWPARGPAGCGPGRAGQAAGCGLRGLAGCGPGRTRLV